MSFLELHELDAALFADFLGHGAGELVGGGAFDRRVGEGADAVELGLFEELQELFEIGIGLAREAGDEGGADGEIGADLAPAADALEVVLGAGRALHGLEDARAGVLEGHVEVGQDLASAISGMMSSTLGYGYVVQAHPHAEVAEGVAQVVELGAQRAAAPEAGAVLHVDAVGRGVLGRPPAAP